MSNNKSDRDRSLAEEIAAAIKSASAPAPYDPMERLRQSEAKSAELRGDAYRAKRIYDDKRQYDAKVVANGYCVEAACNFSPGENHVSLIGEQLEQLQLCLPTERERELWQQASKAGGNVAQKYAELVRFYKNSEPNLRDSYGPIVEIQVL